MIYDLVIIGGGPAGITAGIYAARQKMKILLITKTIGGKIADKAVSIENYTGFESISGIELIDRFEKHLRKHDVEIEFDSVIRIEKQDLFKIKTQDKEFETKTVIVATGGLPRQLNVPGEKEFLGKGVGYCATCDGPLYSGKDIIIAGGGNAGFETAVFMSDIANKVYIVERGDIIASEQIQEMIAQKQNVEVLTNTIIKEIKGNNFVTSAVLEESEEERELNIDGVFIEIGYVPATELVKDLVELNERKEVIFNPITFETKIKGLFCAGDINSGKVKQIICACSDGAKAALAAYGYIKKNNE